ncbi:MAG: lytic transglycosylase domain-containing protein [Armatimonadota bacterium]
MLEGLSSVRARIEEIKTNFTSSRASGPVEVAPHYTSTGPTTAENVQPFFPNYLLKQVQQSSSKSSEGGSTQYDDDIQAAAGKYGLDPALIKAVVKAESGFNANAVSHAGAQGLMQLMPSTASGLGCYNPLDPKANINAGAKYLKGQIDRFGSVDKALAAYNAGPGAVMKYGGVPPYRETQNYVNKVLAYRDQYATQ